MPLHRDPKSHKTQNGTVAVIGGSHRFHGAPIFTALSAEATGVDLVYPFVHECHEDVTRQASLNFIVSTFKGKSLSQGDVKSVLVLLRELDVAVIGPGMEENQENATALSAIVGNSPCSLVLDAGALKPAVVKSIKDDTVAVLTPHVGELEELTGQDLTGVPRREVEALAKLLAKEHEVTVILKGHEDLIVDSKGKKTTVKGGNAGLTKGGTGDVLAGVIAGLMAQGVKPFEACALSARLIKRAATVLYPEKGYAYTTVEVIQQIPHLLHAYEG